MGIDEGMKWMVDYDAAEKSGWRFAPNSQRGRCRRFGFFAGSRNQGLAGDAERRGSRNSSTRTTTPTDSASFRKAHLPTTLRMHRRALARMIPVTKRAISPNAPSRHPAGRPVECRSAYNAFGLGESRPVFDNLPHATAREQLDARQMNTALWQATWGYFLLQMLGVAER